jgi:imidazolonepropionase
MAVGCFAMGLSLEEALSAATVNAAYSLDVHEDTGRLQPGMRADLVVLRSERLLDLVRVGVNAIRTVVANGRIVVRDGRRVEA